MLYSSKNNIGYGETNFVSIRQHRFSPKLMLYSTYNIGFFRIDVIFAFFGLFPTIPHRFWGEPMLYSGLQQIVLKMIILTMLVSISV